MKKVIMLMIFTLSMFLSTKGFSMMDERPMREFKRKTVSFFSDYVIDGKASKETATQLLDEITKLDPNANRYTDNMDDTRYEDWYESLEDIEKELFRFMRVGTMDKKDLAEDIIEYHYRSMREYNQMFSTLAGYAKSKENHDTGISSAALDYANYYLDSYKELEIVVDKMKDYEKNDHDSDEVREGNYILDRYDFMEESAKQIEYFKETEKMKNVNKLLKMADDDRYYDNYDNYDDYDD